MPDKDGNRSNPYHPDPDQCCEACVFGRGEHAAWCLYRFTAADLAKARWYGGLD